MVIRGAHGDLSVVPWWRASVQLRTARRWNGDILLGSRAVQRPAQCAQNHSLFHSTCFYIYKRATPPWEARSLVLRKAKFPCDSRGYGYCSLHKMHARRYDPAARHGLIRPLICNPQLQALRCLTATREKKEMVEEQRKRREELPLATGFLSLQKCVAPCHASSFQIKGIRSQFRVLASYM